MPFSGLFFMVGIFALLGLPRSAALSEKSDHEEQSMVSILRSYALLSHGVVSAMGRHLSDLGRANQGSLRGIHLHATANSCLALLLSLASTSRGDNVLQQVAASIGGAQ